MPVSLIDVSVYPKIGEHFASQTNLAAVLTTLQEQFYHWFDIEALELALSTDRTHEPYFKMFSDCVRGVPEEFFTREEILPILVNQLFGFSNAWNVNLNYTLPDLTQPSMKQIGFWEKLSATSLRPDLDRPENLRQFGLTSLDILRTIFRSGNFEVRGSKVLELRHVPYLDEKKFNQMNPWFLRSSVGDLQGLSQWMVFYPHNGQYFLYTESSLLEEDKILLKHFFAKIKIDPKKVMYEVGSVVLSMSSGMRAVSRLIERKGGAGLTASADYPSLLIEWMWFIGSGFTQRYDWFFFLQNTVRYNPGTQYFALMDFFTPEVPGENKTLNQHLQMRSYALGIDWLLADPAVNYLLKDEARGRVRLAIPENFSETSLTEMSTVFNQKYKAKAHYGFSQAYLKRRTPEGQESFHHAPPAFVLIAFRACANLKNLSIHLPIQWQLDASEISLIRQLMQTNPFVCELMNETKNKSIEDVREQILPVLARNRWLSINLYRPPLLAPFWDEAAGYWIEYLKQASSLIEQSELFSEFRRCVKEMGLQGLRATLVHLQQHEALLRPVFNRLNQNREHPPLFYLACRPQEMGQYIAHMQQYLDAGHYFPFHHLTLAYQPGYDDLILRLLEKLHEDAAFEKISLVECLNPKDAEHTEAFKQFLKKLEGVIPSMTTWRVPVYVEELEHPSSDEVVAEIRAIYLNLNNLLMQRRRHQHAQDLAKIQVLTACSTHVKDEESVVQDEFDIQAAAPELPIHHHLKAKFENALLALAGQQFFLNAQGEISLQMQQQQQIKQERQIQLEQELEIGKPFEDQIASVLVTYDTIDEYLGEYYEQLHHAHSIDLSKATLGDESATPLQRFYHTWVNAHLDAKAPHAVGKMTIDAAKMLLKHHQHLASGLNLEHLPRGFYLQRNADQELILAYQIKAQQTTDVNALTLNFGCSAPKAQLCLGDARQFLSMGEAMTFSDIQWFSQLQPEFAEDQFNVMYDEFLNYEFIKITDAPIKSWIQNHVRTIKNHWHLFYSLYLAYSVTGVQQFKRMADENKLLLSSERLLGKLFEQQTPDYQHFAQKFFEKKSASVIRALAQVYFQYGDYGIERFLTVLLSIQQRLGPRNLGQFFDAYLVHCESFTYLLQGPSLESIATMLERLSSDQRAKQLWFAMLGHQTQCLGWSDLTQLWKAFVYFDTSMRNLGIHSTCTSEWLASFVKPQDNLLVCWDRIRSACSKIPDQERQRRFLKELRQLDLTAGGVFYALMHDGMVDFDRSLALTDFYQGQPTYAVDLQHLFHWNAQESALWMNRALASGGQLTYSQYQQLKNKLLIDVSDLESKKLQLILALHSKLDAQVDVAHYFDEISPILAPLIRHMHHVFYEYHAAPVHYSSSLWQFLSTQARMAQLSSYFEFYPDSLVFLNVLQHFLSSGFALNDVLFKQLCQNLEQVKLNHLSHPFSLQAILLASIWSLKPQHLQQFFQATQSIKKITCMAVNELLQQLDSLDLKLTKKAQYSASGVWESILEAIKTMDERPLEQVQIRQQLIETLVDTYQIQFKVSINGAYRKLENKDLTVFALQQNFESHGSRLERFFLDHIAIADHQDGPASMLQPLVQLFENLQRSKTYINEIEPLLAMFENTLRKKKGCVWEARVFTQLLSTLQSEDGSRGLPISILEILITDPRSSFVPHPLNELVTEFPAPWSEMLLKILAKSETFSRHDQLKLTQLALLTYSQNGSPDRLLNFINELMQPIWKPVRPVVLSYLVQEEGHADKKLAWCRSFLTERPESLDEARWSETLILWIQKAAHLTHELDAVSMMERRGLIAYVVAWSALSLPHLISVAQEDYVNLKQGRKIKKLIQRLQNLPLEDVQNLAVQYPAQPMPDARQLLGLIKSQTLYPKPSLCAWVDKFKRTPAVAKRRDFQAIESHREQDWHRMLRETTVLRGSDQVRIDVEQALYLDRMRRYLKSLEQGKTLLEGVDTALFHLDQATIKERFQALSNQSLNALHQVQRLKISTQIWAILFEVLGRTTGKYPHLAQQFAFLANDLMMTGDPSTILQLKTGEGKSHFVALRAARHVGQGRRVDVCTAKWTLAERDALDYRSFFDYLGIPWATIHAKSSRQDYLNAQVVYTTPGELSLFLDEHASQGQKIDINREQRVALGDEFDFLYYEGQKTQFNYARFTGVSPKNMIWFYEALNDYYDKHLKNVAHKTHGRDLLNKCFIHLLNQAKDSDLAYLEQFLTHPMILFSWIQSSVQAAELEADVHYTVRLEQVRIGGDEIALKEIYPLTKDMQAAVGSTFSYGVHQLLATRLNQRARSEGLPQNHHVHPESHILSSQIFSQRLKSLYSRWEGFTGTVSVAQAHELQQEYRTAILQVPTNQKDLRHWHEARFFDSQEERVAQMVADIQQKLAHKKSILLCCATDAEVLMMTKTLKKHFSLEYFEQYFMSYTNQSHLSASELLRLKQEKEGEEFGCKQQGVVLIAAGFGRGDNVGVEAVMLANVHDLNDLGQKGGRTARNGAEGEVHQYYLRTELEETYQSCCQAVQELLPIQEDGLDEFKKFSLILNIREFLAAREQRIYRIYHEAKARLSESAIEFISQLEHPTTRDQAILVFSIFLDQLNKQWLEISSSSTPEKSDEDKLDQLYQFILCRKDRVFLDAQGHTIQALDFAMPQIPEIKLVLQANKPSASDKDSLQLSKCLNLMNHIQGLHPDAEELDDLIPALARLPDDHLEGLRTLHPLSVSQLSKILNTIAAPSCIFSPYMQKHSQGYELFVAFMELPSNIAQELDHYLKSKTYITDEQKVHQGLELVHYCRQLGMTKPAFHSSSLHPFELIQNYLNLNPLRKSFVQNHPIAFDTLHALNKFVSEKSWSEPMKDEVWMFLVEIFSHDVLSINYLESFDALAKSSQNPSVTLRSLRNLLNRYLNTEHQGLALEYLTMLANKYQHLSSLNGLFHSNHPEALKLLDQWLSQCADYPEYLNTLGVDFINFIKNNSAKQLKIVLQRLTVSRLEQITNSPIPFSSLYQLLKFFDHSSLTEHEYLFGEFLNLASKPNFNESCFQDLIAIRDRSSQPGTSLDSLYKLLKHFNNDADLIIQQYLDVLTKQYIHLGTANLVDLLDQWLLQCADHPVQLKVWGKNIISILEDQSRHYWSLLLILPWKDLSNENYQDVFQQWMDDQFEDLKPEHQQARILVLQALKKGLLVSECLSIDDHARYFAQGLRYYQFKISEVLQVSDQPWTPLTSWIEELKQVADVPASNDVSDCFMPDSTIRLMAEDIQLKLKQYKSVFGKNREREEQFSLFERQMNTILLHQRDRFNHQEVLTKIKLFKQQLICQDVFKASQQFFPRLHFWGQSRMYQMLNDIEMAVERRRRVDMHELAQWSTQHDDEMRQQSMEDRRNYIGQLRVSLNTWNNSKQFNWFKSKAVQLSGLLNSCADDEAVIRLLHDPQHQKLINALPGVLLAVVRDVVHHCPPLQGQDGPALTEVLAH